MVHEYSRTINETYLNILQSSSKLMVKFMNVHAPFLENKLDFLWHSTKFMVKFMNIHEPF